MSTDIASFIVDRLFGGLVSAGEAMAAALLGAASDEAVGVR